MGEIKANFIPGSQRPVPVVLTVRDWHTGRSEDWVICQVRLSYVRTINDLVHMGLRPASWLLPIGSMGFCLLLVYVNGFLLSVRLSREIVTAVDSLSYATSQVSKGDLSAKVTVRNRGQLGSLAASFNNMTLDLRRLYDQEKEVARTEWEIALAREVQLQLYGPRKFFSSGTTVWGTNIPARIVSGDLFEIFPYSTSRVGMLCADVSGKGISAAMLASHLHALVQARLLGSEPSHRRPSPGALDSSLNRDLLRRFGQNRFVTMIYGEVDLERNTFCYVNAGHCHPLLISSGAR